jgi:hypothetical protein
MSVLSWVQRRGCCVTFTGFWLPEAIARWVQPL